MKLLAGSEAAPAEGQSAPAQDGSATSNGSGTFHSMMCQQNILEFWELKGLPKYY